MVLYYDVSTHHLMTRTCFGRCVLRWVKTKKAIISLSHVIWWYISMHMCTHVCCGTLPCACMCGGQKWTLNIFYCSASYFLRQSISTSLELTHLTRLGEILLCLLPSARVIGPHCHIWLLCGCLGSEFGISYLYHKHHTIESPPQSPGEIILYEWSVGMPMKCMAALTYNIHFASYKLPFYVIW